MTIDLYTFPVDKQNNFIHRELSVSGKQWAKYNGFIAYCLMALLFTGEYLVRLRVKKLNDN